MKNKNRTKEQVILEILFDAGVKFDKTDFELYKTIFDNGYYFSSPHDRIIEMLDDNIERIRGEKANVDSIDLDAMILKLSKFKDEIIEQMKVINEPNPGMYLQYKNRFNKNG